MKIYRLQADEGRYFAHEHPATASSWREGAVNNLVKRQGVSVVVSDLCMFGLKTWGEWTTASVAEHRIEPDRAIAARKRTKFMTNSAEVARAVHRRCDQQHPHQALVNGRAKKAEEYMEELKEAFVLFDSDHNGSIDIRELKAAIRALGYETTKKECIEMFKEVDTDPS